MRQQKLVLQWRRNKHERHLRIQDTQFLVIQKEGSHRSASNCLPVIFFANVSIFFLGYCSVQEEKIKNLVIHAKAEIGAWKLYYRVGFILVRNADGL